MATTPPAWLVNVPGAVNVPISQPAKPKPQSQAQKTLANLQLPAGLIPIYFGYSNLTGTTTDTKLYRTIGGATVVAAQIGVVVPFNGSIVAISVVSNEARTAGAPVFTSRVAGTNALSVTWSSGTSAYAVAGPSDHPVLAGNEIDVRVTTSGFTPTTADVEVAVFLAQSA